MQHFYICKEYMKKLVEPPFNGYRAYDKKEKVPGRSGFWDVIKFEEYEKLEKENERLKQAYKELKDAVINHKDVVYKDKVFRTSSMEKKAFEKFKDRLGYYPDIVTLEEEV